MQKHRRQKNGKYLSHVRGFGCLTCNSLQSDAHHLRIAQQSGMGTKVDDRYTVPLCRQCHMDLHALGDENLWWSLKGVDPIAWSDEQWRAYNA